MAKRKHYYGEYDDIWGPLIFAVTVFLLLALIVL